MKKKNKEKYGAGYRHNVYPIDHDERGGGGGF